MSRIGKKIIIIPEGVDVQIITEPQRDALKVNVKGPKGSQELFVRPEISVEKQKDHLVVKPKNPGVQSKMTRALWGLTRNLLNNMIIGVTQGFEKDLEIQGVGYRARLEGKDLILELGFTHPIQYAIPEGIEIKLEKNIVSVQGINKQQVGQVAAEIRGFRKPEPYKGKGIRYVGEYVRRKAGKKAATEGGASS